MDIGKELRRNQHTLVCTGAGINAFAIWSMVKTCMLLFLQEREKVVEKAADLAEKYPWFIWMVFGLVSLIFLPLLLIHLYVGLSARAEGYGRRRGLVYIVVAAIMDILYVVSIYSSVLDLSGKDPDGMDMPLTETLVSITIDITTVFILTKLVISAIRVKRILAAMAGAKKEE